MSGLGNTGVGEVFARPATRAAGLQGKLAPRPQLVPPPSSEADHTSSSADAPGQGEASKLERPARKRPAGVQEAGDAPPAPARSTPVRSMTLVYVTDADRAWIAEQRMSGRTTAQVVLAAIEAHAQNLPAQFRPLSGPARTGLFSTSTAAQPAREPLVQLGMSGILSSDLAVLSRLVEEANAPSLSALVRAALRLAREADG